MAAIKRAQDAFAAVTSVESEYAKHPIGGWAGRNPRLSSVIGNGIAAGVLGAGIAAFIFDWSLLWFVPPLLAGGSAIWALEARTIAIADRKRKSSFKSKDVEPIVATLRGVSGEERALMRLFVKQHTSELETAKRLTPEAAHNLREAIQDAVADAGELDRVSFVVTFVSTAKNGGLDADSLESLRSTLRAATADERVASAEFLGSTLFPGETPWPTLTPEMARDLFAVIALARKGEASPAPMPTAA